MPPADRIRLLHMRDAAREAAAFATGYTPADLADDRLRALALIKCIEIIGEAASRVSADTRSRFPQIPWADIVAMRNRLIHAYFDIDLDLVLATVESDIPSLLAAVESALDDQGA